MRLGVDHHHVTGGHHLPDIILGVLLPRAAFQANLGLQVGFTTSCLTSSLPPWYGLSLFSLHGHREHGQGPVLPRGTFQPRARTAHPWHCCARGRSYLFSSLHRVAASNPMLWPALLYFRAWFGASHGRKSDLRAFITLWESMNS